jgi:antitoxin PrlF
MEQGILTRRSTKRARLTIPIAVRAALGIRKGDELAYRIGSDYVILTKAGERVMSGPFATFDEWSSEADRRGYAEL